MPVHPSLRSLRFAGRFVSRLHACSAALLLAALPLGCATGASNSLPSSQQSLQSATSTGVVPPHFFGMVVRHAVDQPAVAAPTRRLWDAGVTWAAIEPAPGVYSWGTLDAEVAAAERAGAEVVLTLGMTPTWASSQPGAPSSYGAGAPAMPAHLSDWDAYVSAVATRYAGRIAAYEVWNNPGDTTYWAGSGATLGGDMAQLSSRAALAIRAADANAQVVAPAMSPTALSAFLAAGGGASVDVYSMAPALAGATPETFVAEVAAIRHAAAGTSAESKPLWDDQSSWKLPAGGLSDTDQAAWVARALLINASFGVDRLLWYAWDESDATTLRLVDEAGLLTPAAGAYAMVEGWLSGAAINGCSADAQQVWRCQIVRNGSIAWVLWSAGGMSVSASSMGLTTVTDLSGVQQAVDASGSLLVSGSPVLLQ